MITFLVLVWWGWVVYTVITDWRKGTVQMRAQHKAWARVRELRKLRHFRIASTLRGYTRR